jgi:hypothetical protein
MVTGTMGFSANSLSSNSFKLQRGQTKRNQKLQKNFRPRSSVSELSRFQGGISRIRPSGPRSPQALNNHLTQHRLLLEFSRQHPPR